jgi:hypothetical protein
MKNIDHPIVLSNKKNPFLLTIIYLVFFSLIISSNYIILSIPFKNTYKLVKSNITSYNSLPTDVEYSIDSINQNQDILHTVEMSGWVYHPSVLDNSIKVMKVIFISSDNSYEVNTVLQERFDLKEILNKYTLSNYEHGFVTKFSPLAMKNGNYQLYLYYDNEVLSGVIDTGKLFTKDYRTFSESENISIDNQ